MCGRKSDLVNYSMQKFRLKKVFGERVHNECPLQTFRERGGGISWSPFNYSDLETRLERFECLI